MRKTIIYYILVIILLGTLISGCNKKGDKGDSNKKNIIIGCDIGCSPLVNDLIKDFSLNNKTNIKQEYLSLSQGLDKLKSKKLDMYIGYTGIEDKSIKKSIIAYDGIAIIVNKNNQVNTISIEQLNKIYSGSITEWKEINAGQENILPISYESSMDFNTLGLNQFLNNPIKETLTSNSVIVSDILGAKEKVASLSNCIAFVPGMYLENNTKTLLLNGIVLKNDSLSNDLYPLKNSINSYYLEKNENYKSILEYIKSEDGKKIIKKHCSSIK